MPETAARTDPYVGFRFEIRLDGLPAGGFAECTGIGLETEVQDYNEGGVNDYVHKFPSRTKQSPLTLKKGIVDRQLYDWFWEVAQGLPSYRGGAIVVRDPAGERAEAVWEFKRAFPSKWTGPDLNAGQSAVAMESLELVHRGLERRK